MMDFVTEANIEAGAKALAPSDYRYLELWSRSRTNVGSGDVDARKRIEIARRQSRAVLEAVAAMAFHTPETTHEHL